MRKDPLTSYAEALGLVLEHIKPLSAEEIPLGEATDRVASAKGTHLPPNQA